MSRSLAGRLARLERQLRAGPCSACGGRGGTIRAAFLTEDGATWTDGRAAALRGDRCAECGRRVKCYAGFSWAEV